MSKLHPYGLPFCEELERCARYRSDYCCICRTITKNDKDLDYFVREPGD